MTRTGAHHHDGLELSSRGQVATRAHGADAPTTATTVHLPVDPSGAVLATVIREVRLAILRGDVIIDSRQASRWSPGPRLVLHRLQRLTHRAGHRWHDLAADIEQQHRPP